MDDEARELINKLTVGKGVKVEVVRARNPKFHRLLFALLKLAFDLWEPEVKQYKGEIVQKEFKRFWKDIIILSGHYTTTINIRGEVRLEAKSISFANMDETEFSEVYKSVLDVVWRKVLKDFAGYATKDDVDRVVQDLVRFE